MEAATAETFDFPRAPQIFNHDVSSCTADGVLGNHLYSSRALAATEPDDIIQLHPDLKDQWELILEHYDRVGLNTTRSVIWDIDPQQLAANPKHDPSVFFFGPTEHGARPDESWLKAVEAMNCKNSFMQIAEELRVSVPRTLRFDSVQAISDADIASAPYPCYLKAAISVSGIGIYRCEDAAALRDAMTRFEPETPVQIQQEVIADTFLNMQYEIESNALRRLATTEQVLDGFVHQGNRHPARAEPWHVVEPMAVWLFRQGMRGVFAFDVAVVPTDLGERYFAIECNPRYNGASYPTAVAHKLGVEHWLARSFQTRHRHLADLDLSGIEYDPRTGTGVVLVNWGPILVGKLLVLIAGDEWAQERLTQELLERL